MDAAESEVQVKEVIRAVRDISWNEAATALLTLAVGLAVIKIVMHLARRATARFAQLNSALTSFLLACLRLLMLFVLVTMVIAQLGIPVTSLVAVVSLFALAFSLSIQNQLTNVASGMAVLIARPFEAGDWIETPSASGTVEAVDLLYTRLVTADNQLVLLPNSQLSGQRITNYSSRPMRRINVTVTVGYEHEAQRVIDALMRAAQRFCGEQGGQSPFAAVNAYRDSGVEYVARLMVPTKAYWAVYHPFLLAVREELAAAGASLTYGASRVALEYGAGEAERKRTQA